MSAATAAQPLHERAMEVLRSRLYEMCKTVMIEGEDYRKTIAHKNA